MTAEPKQPESATLVGPERFGRVLFFVLLTLIALTFLARDGWSVAILVLLPGATLLVTLWATDADRRLRVIATGAVIASAPIALAAGIVPDPGHLLYIASLALILVFDMAVPAAVALRIKDSPRVSLQTLLAGLVIYLHIGLIFATVYGGIASIEGRSFFHAAGPVAHSDYVYYSFATLTTVGYGDLTAAAPLGRMLSAIEALLGQVYLVTVVALIVSRFGTESRAAREDVQGGD